MKHILLIIAFILFFFAFLAVVYAAPQFRIERTLLPETDSLYELGTSTKAWLRGFFDEICLNGDCETSWPAGGGSSFGQAWEIDSAGDLAATSTTIGAKAAYFIATSTTATSTFAGGLTIGTHLIASPSGNVGIGTSTPYARLSVTNPSAARSFVVEDSASPDATPFSIDASGNLGIGTATPSTKVSVHNTAGNQPYINLSNDSTNHSFSALVSANLAGRIGLAGVNDGGIFAQGFTDTDQFALRFQGHSGVTAPTDPVIVFESFKFDGVDNRTSLAAEEKAFQFRNNTSVLMTGLGGGNVGVSSSSPYAKFAITNTGTGPSFVVEDSTSPDTTPFLIDASGNVGVGTTTPAATLHVAELGGSIPSIAGDTVALFSRADISSRSAVVSILSGNTGRSEINFGDTDAEIVGRIIYDNNTNRFGFYTNALSTERMSITSAGNIGIGTTTPAEMLEIWGDIKLGNTANTTRELIWERSGSERAKLSVNSSNNFVFNIASQDRIVFDAGGNVGIGTTSPAARLDVAGGAGSSNPLFRLHSVTSGFATTTRLVVDSSGNMGIGTTTPGSMLAVNGSAIINDLLTTADFIATSSLRVPQGTAPTVDLVGEVAVDTTDSQVIVGVTGNAARVVRTEVPIMRFTIASSSVDFANGGVIPLPTEMDGYTVTKIRCYVDGGTSKVITITDGTNHMDSLTCGTSVTSDDGSIANSTVNVDEKMQVNMGATSGAVDYVVIGIFGTWTRE